MSYKPLLRKPGYLVRCEKQGRLWVNGQNIHNEIDDECVPDFRCCCRDIAEMSREDKKAEFNRVALRNGWKPIP